MKKKEMSSFKDLDVYKIAFNFTIRVYKITALFPKEEFFGIVSQMRRSAISINSNIAEGCGRGTRGEYKHFIGIARGSTSELEYQIEVSYSLGFIKEDDYKNLMNDITRIGQMLSGILRSLK